MYSMLYISHLVGKGRGVLTSKKIIRDSLIERCPVLSLPSTQVAYLKKTDLYNYYFMWGVDQSQAAILLGYGSIYNHSYTPNALYRPCLEEGVMEIVAIKNILPNEEITVNYNGTPNDQSKLWGEDSIDWLP